jgi:hypothetical protein
MAIPGVQQLLKELVKRLLFCPIQLTNFGEGAKCTKVGAVTEW